VEPSRRLARLSPELQDDFFRLHCQGNGQGWCACVAWWVPTWQGWGERTAAENRAVREALFARGEHDGYLAFEGAAPAAWVQAGPRDRLEKLTRQLALAPDPDVWALTCFFVAPPFRGRGLAAWTLGAVVDDLRARGVRRVEAYPRRAAAGETLDAGDVWTGPEALLRGAGFGEVVGVDGDAKRGVLSLAL
jgi:GNAT superfamily N-acetyltransferase